MDALRQITEAVPTSIAVVASLDDFYEKLRGSLARPLLDRLENDPKPVRIMASRTREEVESLIATRVRGLFEQQRVHVREAEPLWPFDNEAMGALVGLRTRDVLEWCRVAQERCIDAGRMVAFNGAAATTTRSAPPAASALASQWAEFLGRF